MSNKLEPRNPDSITIVFYENDGTHSPLDDHDAKQALIWQAEHVLAQGVPAPRDPDNTVAIGEISIDDDTDFTFDGQPVDRATVAAAVAEALTAAIRRGLAAEYPDLLNDSDEPDPA